MGPAVAPYTRGKPLAPRPPILPHHARDKSRFAPRRLDVVLQEAARVLAGIARPGKSPGAAFVVALAGIAAGIAPLGLVVVLELERTIIAAETIRRCFQR